VVHKIAKKNVALPLITACKLDTLKLALIRHKELNKCPVLLTFAMLHYQNCTLFPISSICHW